MTRRQDIIPGVLELDLDVIDPIAGVICGARVWALHEGDALDLMLPSECADAIIMDPPAGIKFMGAAWDSDMGGMERWVAYWAKRLEVGFRALKPGGHAAIWSLPRTSHWTALAIERAGFEIRDTVDHIHGSGFPKSLDVSKAIDSIRGDDPRPVCRYLRAAMDGRGLSSSDLADGFGVHSRMIDHWAARDTDSQPAVPSVEQWERLRIALGFGQEMDDAVRVLNARKGTRGDAFAEREVIGEHAGSAPGLPGLRFNGSPAITVPSTPEARRWAGWGTALRPNKEVWWIARKPIAKGLTVAANVLRHGVGGINVDAGRVGDGGDKGIWPATDRSVFSNSLGDKDNVLTNAAVGRWPSNCTFQHSSWDESECRSCGVVAPFAVRFCPACGSGDIEENRGGCRCVGNRRVGAATNGGSISASLGYRGGGKGRPQFDYADEDGCETVDTWECLATCDRCGASALVTSGGGAGGCDCGCARRWACAVALLDDQSLERSSGAMAAGTLRGPGNVVYGAVSGMHTKTPIDASTGGASRFYHCFPPEPFEPFVYSAKPPTSEREAGLSHLPKRSAGELTRREDGSAGLTSPRAGAGRASNGRANTHPTIKGFHLIGHFCDLFVPPGGLVLDLCAGSGTLGAVVAHRHQVTGWRAIMAEIDPGHCEIIRGRCKHWGARPWRPRKGKAAKAVPVVVAAQGDLFGGGGAT